VASKHFLFASIVAQHGLGFTAGMFFALGGWIAALIAYLIVQVITLVASLIIVYSQEKADQAYLEKMA
jgi:hypothetical protein